MDVRNVSARPGFNEQPQEHPQCFNHGGFGRLSRTKRRLGASLSKLTPQDATFKGRDGENAAEG